MKNVEIISLQLRTDNRGWVAWPLEETLLKNGALSNLHVPSLRPGAIRGNHYHLNSTEHVLVLSGPCTAMFVDNETGEELLIPIPENEPTLFKIMPNTTHAFRNDGRYDIYLICCDQPSNTSARPDVHRAAILV